MQVPFHSHVLKEVSSFPTSPNGVYNTKFGKMTRPQYVDTHEQLEKLQLIIHCVSLNEQMDNQNDRNFSKRLPPVKKPYLNVTIKNLLNYINVKLHSILMQNVMRLKENSIFRPTLSILLIQTIFYICTPKSFLIKCIPLTMLHISSTQMCYSMNAALTICWYVGHESFAQKMRSI